MEVKTNMYFMLFSTRKSEFQPYIHSCIFYTYEEDEPDNTQYSPLYPKKTYNCTKKYSVLTSIRKAIFTQNKCPLFFMINNCNLCRSAKIYLVNLSYQEKEKDQFILEITCETSIHHNWLHILNRISRVGSDTCFCFFCSFLFL